jgi:CarD family transcriptional regulator
LEYKRRIEADATRIPHWWSRKNRRKTGHGSVYWGGCGLAGSAAVSMGRFKMAAKALSFDVGDYVVYPKHGVGRVVELQSTDIAGMQLELYVLRFEKEKMTLRVPTNKAESVGMRKLSSDKTLRDALETLKGKPKVKRTMWSRRAQEYEAKINSGDLISIAEVTRDLFRADDQPEQSYSERQIFEAASSRLARELAAMEQIDEPAALEQILEILNKAAAVYNKEKAAV